MQQKSFTVKIMTILSLFVIYQTLIFQKLKFGGCGSSVVMIMVQFEDSLRQRSEFQISIRSSYSEKNFYEKKKFDDLWAHYHGLQSQPSDTY
jgi:hypothetical protein